MITKAIFYHRMILFLIFYSLMWAVLVDYFSPEFKESWVIRIIFFIVFIASYVLFYVSKWVKYNIRYILYGVVFSWTFVSSIQPLFMPFHDFILIRPLITLPLFSFIFFHRKWLFLYLSFNLIITVLGLSFADFSQNLLILFVIGYTCIVISLAYVLNSGLKLYERYRSVLVTLANKNRKIEEYAFLNSHGVRAPLARLMGLVHVLGFEIEENEITAKVEKEAGDLDEIIRRSQKILE